MKRMLLLFISLIAGIYILPILYTLTNSFMDLGQLNMSGIKLIPTNFNLQQYYALAFFKGEYFKLFLNSIKITGAIIIGQILVGIITAFAFAKLKFPGKDIIFVIYILVALLPFQVALVPNTLIFDAVGRSLDIKILDTHLAIILPGIFSSFGIFLLKQFITGIPNELIEAARIDGAGNMRIFFRVILPMIKPAVFTLIMLTFIDNWNVVEQAIIFLNTPDKQPLSVFLEEIYHEDFQVFYSGAVLYFVPAILIFLKGEKYLSEGLGIGGLK